MWVGGWGGRGKNNSVKFYAESMMYFINKKIKMRLYKMHYSLLVETVF